MNGSSDPSPREPYGRRPLPARTDWRRALDVYVAGRSRALTADEKRSFAGGARSREAEPESEVRVRRATGRPEAAYGVSVPRVLDFYRNAGTWRDSLPEPKSHGDPALRA